MCMCKYVSVCKYMCLCVCVEVVLHICIQNATILNTLMYNTNLYK